jgi:glutamine amidotransferase
MCELLGMSARHPTDVNHSLALLRPRGGEIGPHADGWGVAFYEGRAARVFKEPVPAAESRCLAFIAEYNYQSTLVIGHIRKANPPDIGRSSANTHPFSRELGGRAWVFAHNGKLPGLREDPRFSLGRFQPMGETDSEHAFCFLLDRIASAQRSAATQVPFSLALQEYVAALGSLGEFNILLSNGEDLVAYSNTKLSWTRRTCLEHGCSQAVILLATTPLTDEPWQPLDPGSLYVFAHGERVTV